MTDQREFTVEEANDLLPWLQEVLPRIREARQVVLRGAERVRRTASTNGGGSGGREYWEAVRRLRQHLEAITEKGIVLRDPETGLVDFPSRREGREVLLCWRLGEPAVGYWHGPQAGFSGRRPL